MRPPAIEHAGKKLLEIAVDLLEDGVQLLAPFPVQMADRPPQFGDRGLDLGAFGLQRPDLLFDGFRFDLGQQVHRSDFIAFPLQAFQAFADAVFRLRAEVGGRFR